MTFSEYRSWVCSVPVYFTLRKFMKCNWWGSSRLSQPGFFIIREGQDLRLNTLHCQHRLLHISAGSKELLNLLGIYKNMNINVVCFLLGDSPASDLYMPTFRNTLSVPSSKAFEDGTDRLFRNVGNILNTAKAWNHEYYCLSKTTWSNFAHRGKTNMCWYT